MLRSFIAALILIMGALSAQAQPTQTDPSPAALWVGGYFGIHGGVGSADFDGVFDSSSIDRPRDNEDAVLGEFFELDGGLAGVHVGFNAKYGRLIYGVEADWSSFDQSARLFDPESEGPNGSTTDNARVDLNWVASLRGRVGLMSARSLLFASAGVAWIDGEYTAHDADGALPGQSVIGSADIGTAGIVIGAGIEHALTNRFLIRLEGLYYTFNNRVATSTLTNDSDPDDFAKIEDIIVARIAASYRFGGSSSSQTSPPIMRNWTGLYAGAHIGYARVGFDSLFDADEISDPRDFEDSVLGRFFDLNGTVGGIQVGYNRSYGRWVVGAEMDWTNLQKSDLLFDPDGGDPNDDSASVDLNWMATFRGRVGVTSGSSLFFATAGVAWITGDYTATDDMISSGTLSLDSIGFVVGGGLEHALNERILIRLEGMHYRFDDEKDASRLTPDSNIGDFTKIDDMTVFRLGVNYKLSSAR